MQVCSSSGSFSHPGFLADDTPGGEGLSSPPSVYVWGWGGGELPGCFRLSPASPHPGRTKSALPGGGPGAWMRRFLGGAPRTVLCQLQKENVLPGVPGKLLWNGSPGSPSPRRRRGWGSWVGSRFNNVLMFGLENAGDLQKVGA